MGKQLSSFNYSRLMYNFDWFGFSFNFGEIFYAEASLVEQQ